MKRTTVVLAATLWMSLLWSCCFSFSHRSASLLSPRKSCSRITRHFLTKNVKSYVPDGLTPEEYQKIKQQEAERLKKMNYGMFGPRFRPSERPDGDWFLTPSLWTTGFKSNLMSSREKDDMELKGGDRRLERVVNFGKKYLPASFLVCTAVHVLFAIATTLFADKMMWRFKQLGLSIWKVNCIKCLVAGMLTYPWQLFIERANRRWMWSKRWTVLTATAAMLGVSVLWSLIVVGLPRSFGVFGG